MSNIIRTSLGLSARGLIDEVRPTAGWLDGADERDESIMMDWPTGRQIKPYLWSQLMSSRRCRNGIGTSLVNFLFNLFKCFRGRPCRNPNGLTHSRRAEGEIGRRPPACGQITFKCRNASRVPTSELANTWPSFAPCCCCCAERAIRELGEWRALRQRDASRRFRLCDAAKPAS